MSCKVEQIPYYRLSLQGSTPIKMTIENTIVQQIRSAVSILYQTEIASDSIVIQETRKEFEGQVTAVTFPFTRFSKKTPEQTGVSKQRRARSLS